MVVAKRGLVAPQNTFLENVIRRCNSTECSFILANAQIIDYPIVYCNDGFSKIVGYSRAEIMQKPCSLSFMYGDQTDPGALQRIQLALDTSRTEMTEIALCKKNKSVLWLLVHIAPIKDDKDRVVLYLIQFKDITPLKQPLGDENNKALGLSRILQIARIAKSRQQFNQIETKDLHKSAASVSSNFNQQLMNLGGDMLPQYRQETPKTSPHIILHYSTQKTVWDWSILALTFYTAFIVPYNIAFNKRDHHSTRIDMVALLDSIVDVIFFADILLNFHTTFVGPGGERIGSLLSALKVVRLLRLGRVARKLDNYLEYGAATLLLLLCAYVLVSHWMACIWYVIGEYELKSRLVNPALPDGWLYKLSNDLKSPFNLTSTKTRVIGGPEKMSCYISALYYTMSCMSTVGFGNIASTTATEKIFGVCMMIISANLYAAIFGHMTTIIQQMTSATVRYHEMITNVREFIKLQEVPQELSERVMDYVVSTWAMTKGIDTTKVLGYCPKDMKADICVHLNRKVFNEHSCFRLASDGCLRSLAMYLESNHAAPGDLLYHTGESVDALWFVVSGSLEVIQDDEVVAILGKGDVFGDEFWKTPKIGQSAANVRALTYTDLHMIKKEKLMEVLTFYKAFANSFARNLVLTYNLTNRLKFRKVMDVKREKELDERRKNEKLEISEDHPIRKLLQRMRERHSQRITFSSMSNDVEKGNFSGPHLSRTTSNQSIMTTTIDETNINTPLLPQAPRTPNLLSRRRSPMLRGRTFEDAEAGTSMFGAGSSMRQNASNGNGNGGLHLRTTGNTGGASGRASSMNNYGGNSGSNNYSGDDGMNHLKRDIQSMLDSVNEKSNFMEKYESRLLNIENMLMRLTNQRGGATPSTLPLDMYPGSSSPYPLSMDQQNESRRPVPPLHLSIESLNNYADDCDTASGGIPPLALPSTSTATGPNVPFIHIEPESDDYRDQPPPHPRQ